MFVVCWGMTLDGGTDGYARGHLDLDGGKEAVSLSGMWWLISSIFFRIEMVEKPECGELLEERVEVGVSSDRGLFFLLNIYHSLSFPWA